MKTVPAPLFSWLENRSVGVLLHPTSLPGPQGIGVLSPAAVTPFLDFLQASARRAATLNSGVERAWAKKRTLAGQSHQALP